MRNGYDVIVIGSGFGGAVSACRLAEKGLRVLVLERGRRWQVEEYPRAVGDPWIFDHKRPRRANGWIDLRLYPRMAVIQGAGVGGGSLIYANVLVEAPPQAFAEGWPPEITRSELEPYYRRVGDMLQAAELPDGQLTARFRLMREGAEKIGAADRFRKLPLAVSFDPEYEPDKLEDPLSESHSRPFVNAHGQEQGTCVHLGHCDIGCPVKAKNTLDLNYLPRAEQHGAEIRPLHLVEAIEPTAAGYRVSFQRLDADRPETGSETARLVILAAGSMGSTELLLRCRNQHKTLPGISPFLGHGWSSNGDFLTPAFHKERQILPSQGPTISAAIDFLDGSEGGERFFIEDGGFPDLLESYLHAKLQSGPRKRRFRVLMKAIRTKLRRNPPLTNVMPWFAQGVDAADGRLRLGRLWYAPWKRALKLDWDIEKSKPAVDAIVDMHKRLAGATGGKPWVSPLWTLLDCLATPHPLGGCNMASTPESGVVDHRGEVFGYPGLYVADGAVVPRAIGLNPSRTIAALAERTVELIETQGEVRS